MTFTSPSPASRSNPRREAIPVAGLLTVAATLLNLPATALLVCVILVWPHLEIPPGRYPFLPLLLLMLVLTIIFLSLVGVGSGGLQTLRRGDPWNLPGLCLAINAAILLGLAVLSVSGFQLQ